VINFIENFASKFQDKMTKKYLFFACLVIIIFLIWFSNIGLLPFSNTIDFLFFAFLGLLFAVYRPGWAFVFLIGSIGMENVNVASQNFGLFVRPYQILGGLIAVALGVRFVMKKINFYFPKFGWHDALPIIFVSGGFLSILLAQNKLVGFKQSVVALSFVVLYFLARIYIQSLDDLKRIAPFFIGGGLLVALYAILQNIIFIQGGDSHEIMPGRPNGTFAEPDWLGIFLVFLTAAIFSLIYYFEKNKNKLLIVICWIIITFTFIALMLTVSRSSWLGTLLVTIFFLKIMLTGGLLKVSEWDWKKFTRALINVIAVLIISIGVIYIFNLSRFQIWNRAASTGGLQKITVACIAQNSSVPEKIANINELEKYGCRHINLEDIRKEKDLGKEIREIYRPDPNVNIRAGIYRKSIEQIKQHPILGIGWGNISEVLGTDERGAGLNASNIFLEIWLGAGLIGIVSFLFLLGYIFIKGAIIFLDKKNEDKTIAVFLLLGWAAVVVPNIFNSGIFLGFLWVYLAIAVSLTENKQE